MQSNRGIETLSFDQLLVLDSVQNLIGDVVLDSVQNLKGLWVLVRGPEPNGPSQEPNAD